MTRQTILSQHRLPRLYRLGLAGLWLAPIGLFVLTFLLSRGLTAGLLDPRLLLMFGVMALPALYIWREGVDVLPEGIRINVHVPHYYAYSSLDNWYYDARGDKRVLTVWNTDTHKVLECRPVLTDWPQLLRALKDNLRYRNWPE